MTFLFFYGLPDETGQNPNWEAIGYPGPLSAPPSLEEAPKTIGVESVGGSAATLEADACVVGSGAGGAVIAAELAAAGRSVVVLEMGAYRNESDFRAAQAARSARALPGRRAAGVRGRVDLDPGRLAAWRGNGRQLHELHPYARSGSARSGRRWAWRASTSRATSSTSTPLVRLGVNDTATSQNRTHKRLIDGCDELGHPHRPLTRNADTACEDPRMCGYCDTGCQGAASGRR